MDLRADRGRSAGRPLGRTYEGYSEDPALVASYAGAFVEGLQGKAGAADFLDDHHVMTTVKHFLGDGGTGNGKDHEHHGQRGRLRDIHAAGYLPAINAGAQIGDGVLQQLPWREDAWAQAVVDRCAEGPDGFRRLRGR
jgi:beta-glucosidase-like glycosyl hydrolase